MKKFLLVLFFYACIGHPIVYAQSVNCDSIVLPYTEDFYSDNGTLPDCWVYNGTYVKWNNWPQTSGNGELMFGAYSAGYPAVLPLFFASSLSKLEITFKTKCGTPAEGDAILIGVADDAGNLLQWIDTITDPNHSRNAWVWHTYNFMGYSGQGSRIAIGRLWNSSGDHWVAIDDISVRQLPNCYPVENLQADNLIDPDGISFSWTSLYEPDLWQVYVDTIGTNIDSVAESELIEVYEPYYSIPEGTLQGGGKYVFFARGVCIDIDNSNWVSYEFGAGTVVMNNTGVADVVTGCGFVVYDNGGPIAGYQDNSNSILTIYPDGVGNQLRVDGGAFGFGSSGATLSIYDGTNASGTPLYTYNTTDGRDTFNTVLATSTQGALTIKFTSSGVLAHTGYELYVHCTQAPSCPRPTNVNVALVSENEAQMDWLGSAANYEVRYRQDGTSTWTTHNTTNNSITLSNLNLDTDYEAYVRSICGAGDTSIPSVTMFFSTHIDCPLSSDLMATNITDTSARLRWTSDGSEWELEFDGNTITTTENPMDMTGLHPNTYYSYRVRTVCELGHSPWSNYYTFNTSNIGIDDIEIIDGLGLYPNPASSIVTVVLEDNAEVSIIDLHGRTCGVWHCNPGRNNIDIFTLTPGIYLVQATSTSGVVTQRLIVK